MRKNLSSNDVQQWLKQYQTDEVPAITDIYIKENTRKGRLFIHNTAHTHELPPVAPIRQEKFLNEAIVNERSRSGIPLYEESADATIAFKENEKIEERVRDEERQLESVARQREKFEDTLKHENLTLKRLEFTIEALQNHLDKSDMEITKLEFGVTYMKDLLAPEEDSYENYAEMLRKIAISKRRKEFASSAYLVAECKSSGSSGEFEESKPTHLTRVSFDVLE